MQRRDYSQIHSRKRLDVQQEANASRSTTQFARHPWPTIAKQHHESGRTRSAGSLVVNNAFEWQTRQVRIGTRLELTSSPCFHNPLLESQITHLLHGQTSQQTHPLLTCPYQISTHNHLNAPVNSSHHISRRKTPQLQTHRLPNLPSRETICTAQTADACTIHIRPATKSALANHNESLAPKLLFE